MPGKNTIPATPTSPIPSQSQVGEVREILHRLSELSEKVENLKGEVNKLQEKYFKRRSKRVKKLLAEKEQEYRRVYIELEQVKKMAEEATKRFVEENIAPLHASLNSLGKIQGMEKLHGAWPTAKVKIGGTVIDKPGIVVRAHWLEVNSIEELRHLFDKLSEAAFKAGVPIVLVVDGRPDHFPVLLKNRREVEALPYFLKEYNGDYVFLFDVATE